MNLYLIFRNHRIIFNNTIYLSIIEVVRLILPLAVIPYLLRIVGIEKYGIVAFVQSIITYFSVTIDFGLAIPAVHNISERRDDKIYLGQLVFSIIIIKVILFFIASITLTIMIFSIPLFRLNLLLFYGAFLMCIYDIIFPVWYFQGVERMKIITIIKFISIILYVLLVFLFIRKPDDYIFIPFFQSVGLVVSGFIGFIFLCRDIRLIFPSCNMIWNIFKSGIPFFISKLSIIFNVNVGRILTGFFLGMGDVAALDIAQRIYTAMTIPIGMFNQAVFPHNSMKKNLAQATKFLLLTILLAVFISAITYIMIPYIIRYLVNEQLEQACFLSRLFCVQIIFAGISWYLGSSVLVAFGYKKIFNESIIYATVIMLLMYFSIYLLGIKSLLGFALMIILYEALIALYRLYYCLKYKLIRL